MVVREPIDLSRPFKEARDDWTAAFERAYLAALLAEHGGNIRAAARRPASIAYTCTGCSRVTGCAVARAIHPR